MKNKIIIIPKNSERLARKVAKEIMELENEQTEEEFEFLLDDVDERLTLGLFPVSVDVVANHLTSYAAKKILEKAYSATTKWWRFKKVRVRIQNKDDESKFIIPDQTDEFRMHYKI